MADSNNNPDIGTEGSNIWTEILIESSSKKDNEEANIFIFGDKASGKKTLIRKMNKELSSFENDSKKTLNIEEDSSKYGLINYSHLTVKKSPDDDSEIVNRVGVWIMNEIMDEDTFLSLIKPEDMLKCICLIVADYSRPWTIQASLKKWADFVYEAFSKLILKFPLDKIKEFKNRSKKYFFIHIVFLNTS